MRRLAFFALPLLLGGCTGLGTVLDHVTTLPGENPNLPQADSENVRRALGEPAPVAPLLPQPGDVWPKAPVAEPTLGEVARNPNATAPGFAPTTVPGQQPGLPASHQPVPARPPARRHGSSTPPGSVQPPLPGGTGIDTGGTGGYRQLTLPNGQPGAIIVPNGNGTSTVIGPDGSVTTVPTKR